MMSLKIWIWILCCDVGCWYVFWWSMPVEPNGRHYVSGVCTLCIDWIMPPPTLERAGRYTYNPMLIFFMPNYLLNLWINRIAEEWRYFRPMSERKTEKYNDVDHFFIWVPHQLCQGSSVTYCERINKLSTTSKRGRSNALYHMQIKKTLGWRYITPQT